MCLRRDMGTILDAETGPRGTVLLLVGPSLAQILYVCIYILKDFSTVRKALIKLDRY